MSLYTSRSSLETYISECQYRALLRYHFPTEKGLTGITSKFLSIDLLVGSCIHLGIEEILNGTSWEKSLADVTDYYKANSGSIIDHKINSNSDEDLEYSLKEHFWLIEALLYAWYKSEYQLIQREYEIVSVEREICNRFCTYKDVAKWQDQDQYYYVSVFLESRIDALFLHKESQELHSYSIKSTKTMGWFTDAMQNRDLQGYLEIWSGEQLIEDQLKAKKEVLEISKFALDHKNFVMLQRFWDKKVPNIEQISAVRFCFLVKGERKEDKRYKENYPLRHNPYVYGYRKVIQKTSQDDDNQELSYEYAYSYFFTNTNNKSGEGRLGKGWEKFAIAESFPGGITNWIDGINEGKIQPDAFNPIEFIINIPEPIRRNERFLENNVAVAQQAEVEKREKLINIKTIEDVEKTNKFLANTKSCTIPLTCDYLPICKYGGQFNQNEWDDLVNGTSELYQIRIPHHEQEREQLEGIKE